MTTKLWRAAGVAAVSALVLGAAPALAQNQNDQGQNNDNQGQNNNNQGQNNNQRSARSAPEFDPAVAGVIAAVVAGGGVILARRRRR